MLKGMFLANESFLKAIGNLPDSKALTDCVQVEIDLELFKNLTVIIRIILNDDNVQKEGEKQLEFYIEHFFQQLDNQKCIQQENDEMEDEPSTQHLKLSSLLRFQVRLNSFYFF